MLIRYIGPFEEVEFEDGRGLNFVKRGGTIEVEDGSRLCEQADWQQVTPNEEVQ